MKTLKLPREAEEIRKEIKQMIPETALPPKQFNPTQAELLNEDENGNRRYGGDLLALKIAVLTGGMKIGTGWKWRVLYWSKAAKLINERKQGYLIPLKDIDLNPGGKLHEGDYIDVTNEPELSSEAAAVFIVPS
ncbi:unnamed protein product [Penicillium nalgiovense]|uniref:Uncharacterized protein n=2 Tax=Penicillium TaxID=5073 RepID=A0A9W4MY78_PENNA|nr:unnamed protein product [Penicillium nalgiovense]CAP87178.1 Pc24g02700 [Penicillium rubens Wisconsin 54-1255]CAG8125744.1 unnamed protein product [Penicillium nalgiovense]CAG8130952.1 unnamed protein product [Penicillium nalgiovense]CAG8133777.1 unnamed protein product [Penicillium nalgiovense]